MADACQVTVTAASEEEASRLGAMAVEARLAACAQVSGPIASTYWWEGAVTSSREWLCVLKTATALVPALGAALRAAHSYHTPEILALPVVGGDADYLQWIESETRPPG